VFMMRDAHTPHCIHCSASSVCAVASVSASAKVLVEYRIYDARSLESSIR